MFRSRFLAAVLLLTVTVLVLGTLGYFLKQEPEYFRRELRQPAGASDDNDVARGVVQRLGGMMNDIQSPLPGNLDWARTYKKNELNALFRERKSGENPIIEGIFGKLPDPRLDIVDDRLLIAFRKGTDEFSTVVNMELRCWLVHDHPNLIALEIISLKAGELPLPKYMALERIAETARKQNIDVRWYRNEHQNPVGLCQLYANQPDPAMVITTLKIDNDSITIGGRHLRRNEP